MSQDDKKFRDAEAESWFATMCTTVSKIRNVRAEQDIKSKVRLPLSFWSNDAGLRAALEAENGVIAWNARADPEQICVKEFEGRGEVPQSTARIVVADGLEVDIPLPEAQPMDMGKEIARLNKQLTFLTSQLETNQKKITPTFLEKAPAAAKEKALQKVESLKQEKQSVEDQLKELDSQQSGRREAVAGLIGLGFLSQAAPSASANVGEGDALPNGARQEDRIRKAAEAWKEEGRKMSAGEIKTDDEWKTAEGFLRRLYGVKDDMSYLSRGLAGDKKKKSEELVTVFAKQVKLADKPAKKKDVEGFMALHTEITGYIVAFSALLNDAPQDLAEEGGEEELVLGGAPKWKVGEKKSSFF